jgi:hypothetical protein
VIQRKPSGAGETRGYHHQAASALSCDALRSNLPPAHIVTARSRMEQCTRVGAGCSQVVQAGQNGWASARPGASVSLLTVPLARVSAAARAYRSRTLPDAVTRPGPRLASARSGTDKSWAVARRVGLIHRVGPLRLWHRAPRLSTTGSSGRCNVSGDSPRDHDRLPRLTQRWLRTRLAHDCPIALTSHQRRGHTRGRGRRNRPGQLACQDWPCQLSLDAGRGCYVAFCR